MSIILATTWNPRGELTRVTRILPVLLGQYSGIMISYYRGNEVEVVNEFMSGKFSSDSRLSFFVNDDWKMSKYMALKKALETPSDYIHYVDMDRLLH